MNRKIMTGIGAAVVAVLGVNGTALADEQENGQQDQPQQTVTETAPIENAVVVVTDEESNAASEAVVADESEAAQSESVAESSAASENTDESVISDSPADSTVASSEAESVANSSVATPSASSQASTTSSASVAATDKADSATSSVASDIQKPSILIGKAPVSSAAAKQESVAKTPAKEATNNQTKTTAPAAPIEKNGYVDGVFYRHNERVNGYVYDGKHYVLFKNGLKQVGVQRYQNGLYYFNPKTGEMVKNKYVTQNGASYLFGKDGKATTDVQHWNGTYYYFNHDTYKRVNNTYLQSRWGQWYLFGADGRIQTDVQRWAGSYYYFDHNTFLRRDNNYLQSRWGDWYLFGSDGRIKTDVQQWAGSYYYFDHNTYLRQDNNYLQSNWGLWYMFGDNGRIATGVKDWYGDTYYFDKGTYLKATNSSRNVDYGIAHFNGGGAMDAITLNHRWYSQLNAGMPQGCEGASLQISASVKGRYYDINALYRQMGYGWNVAPWQGFYGDPYSAGTAKVETIFATAMTDRLKPMVKGIRDLTGAGVGTVMSELRNGRAVVTWGNYNWNLANQKAFHVMTIVGYRNGQFLISDPYATSPREYWLNMGQRESVNAGTNAVGWATPSRMNLTIV